MYHNTITLRLHSTTPFLKLRPGTPLTKTLLHIYTIKPQETLIIWPLRGCHEVLHTHVVTEMSHPNPILVYMAVSACALCEQILQECAHAHADQISITVACLEIPQAQIIRV